MIGIGIELIISISIVLIIIILSVYFIKSKKKKIFQNFISQNNKSKKFINKPLMIIGPSGVGKDTFMEIIINKYPNLFIKCVSCTTRSPRKGEKEGVNYYFISKEEFNEIEERGEIIGKFEKYDNLYGTSKEKLNSVLSNNKIVYFDYNIETAIQTYNQKSIEFNYIALIPPSIEELGNRLRKRGAEDEDSIQKRIIFASKEIELINKSDFLNYIIKNEELDKAINEFELCIKQLYCHLFE